MVRVEIRTLYSTTAAWYGRTTQRPELWKIILIHYASIRKSYFNPRPTIRPCFRRKGTCKNLETRQELSHKWRRTPKASKSNSKNLPSLVQRAWQRSVWMNFSIRPTRRSISPKVLYVMIARMVKTSGTTSKIANSTDTNQRSSASRPPDCRCRGEWLRSGTKT